MADEWFYARQGEQKGPVSATELKQLAASNQLQPSDLIWKEGLAQWVSAGTVKGLFPPEQMQSRAPAPSPAPGPSEPASDVETFEYTEEEDRPRRTRREPGARREYMDDDDLEDRPRRRRRRRQESGGSGLKVFLIVGGIVLLLVILACGGIFFAFWNTDIGPGGPGNSSYNTTLMADPNPAAIGNPMRARATSRNERRVRFRAGQTVEVKVSNSTNRADVDLYIMDPHGLMVTQDIAESSNCMVTFRTNHTGNYRIIVQNLGPATARCRVTYTTR